MLAFKPHAFLGLLVRFAAVGAAAASIAGSVLPATAATRAANQPLRSARQPLHGFIDARLQTAIANGTLPLVYVSQPEFGAVIAYPSTQSTSPTTPIEAIPGLQNPHGLAVDTMGNLYVVEQSALGSTTPSDVKIFRPGVQTPSKVLYSGAGVSWSQVAVDSRGNVYVSSTQGSIDVFSSGATMPSYTLTDPAVSSNGTTYFAVDGSGNVIINYSGPISIPGFPGTIGLAEGVYPGSTSLSGSFGFHFFHALSVGLGLRGRRLPSPSAVAIDKNGELIIADAANRITGYLPGTQTPAFSFASVSSDVYSSIALTAPANKHLFIAPQITAAIYRYAFPSGTFEQQITLPATTSVPGIATFPAPAAGTY